MGGQQPDPRRRRRLLLATIPGSATANILRVAALPAIPQGGTLAANQLCRLGLQFPRSSQAATDTNTGVLRVHAVRFNYTASV